MNNKTKNILNRMSKIAVIRKRDDEYCVESEDNKDWSGGCYDTKEKAEERLKQVEYFKHKDKNDIKDPPNLSYSYIMRKLRRENKDKMHKFQKAFKENFDEAFDNKHKKPERYALLKALKDIDYEI